MSLESDFDKIKAMLPRIARDAKQINAMLWIILGEVLVVAAITMIANYHQSRSMGRIVDRLERMNDGLDEISAEVKSLRKEIKR